MPILLSADSIKSLLTSAKKQKKESQRKQEIQTMIMDQANSIIKISLRKISTLELTKLLIQAKRVVQLYKKHCSDKDILEKLEQKLVFIIGEEELRTKIINNANELLIQPLDRITTTELTNIQSQVERSLISCKVNCPSDKDVIQKLEKKLNDITVNLELRKAALKKMTISELITIKSETQAYIDSYDDYFSDTDLAVKLQSQLENIESMIDRKHDESPGHDTDHGMMFRMEM
jgi:hypothetical protein